MSLVQTVALVTGAIAAQGPLWSPAAPVSSAQRDTISKETIMTEETATTQSEPVPPTVTPEIRPLYRSMRCRASCRSGSSFGAAGDSTCGCGGGDPSTRRGVDRPRACG